MLLFRQANKSYESALICEQFVEGNTLPFFAFEQVFQACHREVGGLRVVPGGAGGRGLLSKRAP